MVQLVDFRLVVDPHSLTDPHDEEGLTFMGDECVLCASANSSGWSTNTTSLFACIFCTKQKQILPFIWVIKDALLKR
jgi:hypothetical protein